jgi:hypothetical protein
MTSSQNGWRALTPTSRLLYTWTVPGDGTRLRLRQGPAGFLLIHLATRFDKQVENLREPLLDDWGYAYRPIRGFVELSNHASGTAIDLNATDHPLGAENTFTPTEEATVNRLLKKYEGCIRWGGNYQNRKDEMHFELDRTLKECRKVARSLSQSPRGRAILAVNPGQQAHIL